MEIDRFEQTLAAARGGDEQALRDLTERHRRELQAHCYRMLGSLGDAEDLVQETLLRAWRRLESFEGRSSLRAWLYKIATNACLDALDKRPARRLPVDAGPASDPSQPVAPPVMDPVWLEPYPDELLADTEPDPEAVYTSKQSIALAFLAALQLLPARQRAVLLLRDVLGWHADEVAEFLQMSVPAANSALQRARTTLEERKRAGHDPEGPMKNKQETLPPLLARYVQAWERADVPALAALLREDAVLAMPPMPTWFRGRESIASWLAAALLGGEGAAGRFRLVPTRANGCDAFAIYQLDPASGRYQALAIQVVELEGGLVRDLTSFLDPRLFPRFGLPATL
ncbi:MAG TPA: sigma-70 family RNA polymerase sigma factor [Myxococcales bacterium]|jgi:RNA polymerase sigma-70 factor (ECF subfamily)